MRLWSFHQGFNLIRENQHFPGLTYLITIWEYVLCLLLENHYGLPQFHTAIIFCSFNPLMTIDQLVLFKDGLKFFYLAFTLHIYFDLLLWNERSLSNTVSFWLAIFFVRSSVSEENAPWHARALFLKGNFPCLVLLRSICFEIRELMWTNHHSRSFWIYVVKIKSPVLNSLFSSTKPSGESCKKRSDQASESPLDTLDFRISSHGLEDSILVKEVT